MARSVREPLRRVGMLMLQLLTVAPLFLLAHCGFEEGARGLALGIPGAFAALLVPIGYLRGGWRKLAFPLATLGCFACVLHLMPADAGAVAARIGYALLCAALVFVLSVVGSRGARLIWLIAGPLLYLVCGAFSQGAMFDAVRGLMFPLVCVDLCALLFYANWQTLSDQYEGKSPRIARRMRAGNAALCAVFLVVVFAVSQFERLKEGTIWLAQAAVRLIGLLLSLLAPQNAPMGGMGGGGPEEMGLPEAGETALFWVIFEKVMMVACAALLLWLLWNGIRRLPKLCARVGAWIRALIGRYFGALEADYVDESESLVDWNERREAYSANVRRALGRFVQALPWREMDNRQRVRSAYVRLRGSQETRPGRTARETLAGMDVRRADAEMLAESYDRARYSEHVISDGEAENARRASL